MSERAFLGARPKGPSLGARAEAAPTSPPVTRTNTSCTACERTRAGEGEGERLHQREGAAVAAGGGNGEREAGARLDQPAGKKTIRAYT
jgi:hypothetical protein